MNHSNSDTLNSKSFQNLDPDTAKAFLREASIGRQRQSGDLSPDTEQAIRMGKQDQSIGYDDAVYALTNAQNVWPAVEQALGKQT